MGEQIVDGKGTGSAARVDKDNNLVVISTNHSEEHIVSTNNQQAYFANTTDTANTLTVGATGGPMLYIRNDSPDKKIVIERISSSASVAGGVLVLKKNMILGTIANNNDHTPVNLNFGSGLDAIATAYNWDETGNAMTGLTGGDTIKSYITRVGDTKHFINGSLILQNNNSLTIEYSNAAGSEFECGIRFYFDDIID